MCMEVIAAAGASRLAKGGGGSLPPLPNMPGAAPQPTAPVTVGGTSPLREGLAGLLSAGPKVADARAIGTMQPEDANLLKKWDQLQPERSKDIDFETLLRLMRGQ